MTDFSLKLLLWPVESDRAALEAGSGPYRVARNLRFAERDWGPYALASWAEKRHLPLYYVDNCWVRAPVSDSIAAEFLQGIGDQAPLEPAADGWRYVIEAEEF